MRVVRLYEFAFIRRRACARGVPMCAVVAMRTVRLHARRSRPIARILVANSHHTLRRWRVELARNTVLGTRLLLDTILTSYCGHVEDCVKVRCGAHQPLAFRPAPYDKRRRDTELLARRKLGMHLLSLKCFVSQNCGAMINYCMLDINNPNTT